MSRRATLVRSFTQADFDAFATLSGDDNPIHVDPEFSAGTRFGKTVAHGALLCSVLRGLVAQLAPAGRSDNQPCIQPLLPPARRCVSMRKSLKNKKTEPLSGWRFGSSPTTLLPVPVKLR